MQDKDYNLLQEAYSKINEEAHDFPPMKTSGREWHNKGAEEPSPKVDINDRETERTNPFIKEEPKDPLTQDLLSLIDRFEEQHGEGKPNIHELAKAMANVIKELYGSHNKMPFLSTIDRLIKDK